jgi:hypothetical protein
MGALDLISQKVSGGPLPPGDAYTDKREELLVIYSVAEGVFHEGPVITISGPIYSLEGKKIGTWEGVDQPAAPLELAFLQPDQPPPPFNSPNDSPVQEVQVLSWSKGIWKFDDGSTITAAGPAQLRAIIWTSGQGQLWVSAAQSIGGGTGKYAGVQGLKTVSGTSWIPPGPGGSPPDFNKLGPFPARTIDVFRLVRAGNIGQPPGPPPSS